MTPLALSSVSCKFKVNLLEPRQLEPMATEHKGVCRVQVLDDNNDNSNAVQLLNLRLLLFLPRENGEFHQSSVRCRKDFLSGKEVSWLFLICRRARRQRSQSPIMVTVRIDKHIKLYNEWSLRVKSKSSQLASQVMESTSTFLSIAQSAIRKASAVQSSYSKMGHHSR